jgi:hypothetical protein
MAAHYFHTGPMGSAALPAGALQHRRDRALQPLVGVACDQADPMQPAGDQAPQERRPARSVLGGAHLQPQQLAVPIGVAGRGHQHRGVADSPALADLHRQRIDPHKRVRAGVQGPAPPGGHRVVELSTDPRDLRLGDPLQPHRTGHIVHPAGRHPLHVALGDHRGQRPLGPPARLQQRREVAPLPQLGDRQLNRAHTRVPLARPIPVAPGDPVGGALAVGGADLAAHLDLHQRLGQHPHPLAEEVDIAALGLAQQLQ